jgi:hypothetical protein
MMHGINWVRPSRIILLRVRLSFSCICIPPCLKIFRKIKSKNVLGIGKKPPPMGKTRNHEAKWGKIKGVKGKALDRDKENGIKCHPGLPAVNPNHSTGTLEVATGIEFLPSPPPKTATGGA